MTTPSIPDLIAALEEHDGAMTSGPMRISSSGASIKSEDDVTPIVAAMHGYAGATKERYEKWLDNAAGFAWFGTHRRALAEALRGLHEQVATLQGDRCDVCDEDGLIFVPVTCSNDGVAEQEEAQMCPACDGTRSGVTTRVIKDRDEAKREAESLRALLAEALPYIAIEAIYAGDFDVRFPEASKKYDAAEGMSGAWHDDARDLLARIDLARGKDGAK